MPVSKKTETTNKISAFVDFIPAELRQNKDWIIIYYAKNPVNQLLERQRIRVPKIKSNSDRLQFARKMVLDINAKLLTGWSPFFNESGKNYKSWNDAVNDFEKYIQKQFKDNILRKDTVRTYSSNLNLLKQFIFEKKMKITFALQINKTFCIHYLDWIYMDRENSARTRNNHLIFIRLFTNYLVGRGILAENPTIGIKNLPKTQKKRIYIPIDVRLKIQIELETWNSGFYCLCNTIYYCFIRNTELGKLKVKFIDLEKNIIFIPKEISKNKKDESVTIPNDLKIILKKHIVNAKDDDFLFSSNDFYPGAKQFPVRKIQNYWDRLHKKIYFKKEYQFYSFKDTGITDLFLAGLPSIKIRNQARHSSVQITELYTPKNMNCDDIIKNANTKF